MNIEEIIGNLKYMISGQCTDTQFDFKNEVEFAIERLEKEIPYKPIKTSDPHNGQQNTALTVVKK